MHKLPKPVQKLVFSMSGGRRRNKNVIKNFAREEFGLKHHYAMMPHTDEPDPYLHLTVNAMSDECDRSPGPRRDQASED